ncbi:MAG: hypothetical protein ACRC8B_04650 [Aeromonas sobria]|uniref:hypothetical protein n=1 Tax=Aeromonas sobria TaxID=646 RepID=UPI003F30A249
MDSLWVKIITTTGAVGVTGFLLNNIINNIFDAEVINLFGSEKIFHIITLLIVLIVISLLVAIMKYKSSLQPTNSTEPSKKVKINYKEKSTHNGDNNF